MKDADCLLRERAEELLLRSRTRAQPQFMGFLDERQRGILSNSLTTLVKGGYFFFGGCEDAKRTFLALDFYEAVLPSDVPIAIVEFTFRRQDKLTHRDFLGALMAQGIKRESVGDILIEAGKANVFLEQKIAPFLMTQVQKIGSIGVKTQVILEPTVAVSESFVLLEGTVPSLRLDCIVGLCTTLSREKTKNLLLSKVVALNHIPCQNPVQSVALGDEVTIRGYGKYSLDSIGSETKKNRRHIIIKHLV